MSDEPSNEAPKYYQPYYEPGYYVPPTYPTYGHYPPPPHGPYPGAYHPYPPYQHIHNIHHGVIEGGEIAEPIPEPITEPEEPQQYEVHSWVPTTGPTCKGLEGLPLPAGLEGWDGSPLWICRAEIDGDLVPGKAVPKHGVAYIPYKGDDREVDDIEVFCTSRPDVFAWVSASKGSVPPEAIIGGHTATGENLYIGRTRQGKSITPGKVHPSHGCLYIPFGGKEMAHTTYEVLCRKYF